jgi:hypothetical protein
MKVQKFGLAHEWQNDNVKEMACMSQNVDEHVACKEITTQIKCEEFLTFPQNLNKSNVDRGDNGLGRKFACLKVPQNCCKNLINSLLNNSLTICFFLSTPSYLKNEGKQ